MAHSHGTKTSKRNRYLLYAIPLIALIAVAAALALYAAPIPSSPAAMDYTFQILIQISNKNSSSVRAFAPGNSIGEAGGYWATTQYNGYGVDATHYPIYMDSPSTACVPVCTVHVKSTIVYNYTLGDFFNVWGQTLGENNTIGQPSQGSFLWQMCLGASQPSTQSNAWGALPLSSSLAITLNYYDTSAGIPYCGPG